MEMQLWFGPEFVYILFVSTLASIKKRIKHENNLYYL